MFSEGGDRPLVVLDRLALAHEAELGLRLAGGVRSVRESLPILVADAIRKHDPEPVFVALLRACSDLEKAGEPLDPAVAKVWLTALHFVHLGTEPPNKPPE